MALIQCSKCGKEISTEATVCPYCGCPQNCGVCESQHYCIKGASIS